MRFFTIVITCALICGCGSGSCISFGGSYKDASGNVQYCFDKPASNAAGRPVLAGTDGKKNIILGEDDLKKIVEKLDAPLPGSKEIRMSEAQDPIERIAKFLRGE